MLEDELKELKLVLKDKEKYIYKLSSRPRNDQFEIEKVKRELSDKCNQVKAMELSFDKKMKHIISEKDAVIANVTSVKVALGHQNLELMVKLRGIQREVHPIQNEWKIKANALEDSLKAEKAEKKACYEKIKKLENLLKDREDSFNKQRKMEGVVLQMDDVIENVLPEQNNLELMAELRSVQKEIPQRVEEWKTKVNALKERVKFEQGEKEACKAPPASTAPQAKKRPRSPSPGTSSKKFRPEEKQLQGLKPTCPKNSTTGVLPTKRIVSLVSRPGFSAPTARQGTKRPRSPSAEPSSKKFTPEEKGVKEVKTTSPGKSPAGFLFKLNPKMATIM